MNIDGVFKSLVALGATWVLWLLVVLSVWSLYVIIERGLFFRSIVCARWPCTRIVSTSTRIGAARLEVEQVVAEFED